MQSQLLQKVPSPAFFLALFAVLLSFNTLLVPGILLIFLSILVKQGVVQSLDNLKRKPIFILFSSSYLLYLMGMLYTENTSFGIRDLEYKFSILLFPIIIASIEKLKEKEFQMVKMTFIAAVLLSFIVSFFLGYYNNYFTEMPTYSQLSTFLHPTYFSTYCNLAFVFLVTQIDFKRYHLSRNVFLLILLFAILVFNILLNSKIGIIANVALILVYALGLFRKISRKAAIAILSTLVISGVLAFTQLSVVKGRFASLSRVFDGKEISKDARESTAVRVLIWEQALQIISDNPAFGVGTGDSKDTLMEYYEKNGISYAYLRKLNAHNQYLEWGLTFGFIGLTVLLFSIAYPSYLSLRFGNNHFLFFTLIVLVIFSAESFLEKEAGVVFFTFFNSLLFFHAPLGNK